VSHVGHPCRVCLPKRTRGNRRSSRAPIAGVRAPPHALRLAGQHGVHNGDPQLLVSNSLFVYMGKPVASENGWFQQPEEPGKPAADPRGIVILRKGVVFRARFAAIAVFACLSSIATARGEAQAPGPGQPGEVIVADTLDLLTLNVAHGRGTALNQLLVSREGHRKNLADIATILLRSGAHVMALQEADAPSWWSGSFDHVQLIAESTDYTSVVHGLHADSWLYSYGAALISRAKLHHTESHSFSPSWPTATKGYVLGTVRWCVGPDSVPAHPVTVVSAHLDFSRKSVRAARIAA